MTVVRRPVARVRHRATPINEHSIQRWWDISKAFTIVGGRGATPTDNVHVLLIVFPVHIISTVKHLVKAV